MAVEFEDETGQITREIKWQGRSITLTRWGAFGMWGVPESALIGCKFYGRRWPSERLHKPEFWCWIIEGKHPNACHYGRYEDFNSLRELVKAHPDAIEQSGASYVWMLAGRLKKDLNETNLCAGIPNAQGEKQ